MQDEKKDQLEAVALFRYGLIADLVRLERGTKGLHRMLQQKAEKDYAIPGSTRTRVAEETLRCWLKAYRKNGFEALKPRPRRDVGQSRALPQEVRDLLVTIKDDSPELSVQLVIKEALATKKVPAEVVLAPSTVHRALSRAGLMRREGEVGKEADRRRFAHRDAGELWMSDVMHGPAVTMAGRQRRKTYLIGFIDDATHGSFPSPPSLRRRTPPLSCPRSSRL